MIIKLNQNWNIQCERTKELYLNNNVPCSVYKALIDNNKIPDPYYRENEYMSTSICDDDYTFTKNFHCQVTLHSMNISFLNLTVLILFLQYILMVLC